MLIAPVADLLEEPEIIIFPDRCLYKVPFAALKQEIKVEGIYQRLSGSASFPL